MKEMVREIGVLYPAAQNRYKWEYTECSSQIKLFVLHERKEQKKNGTKTCSINGSVRFVSPLELLTYIVVLITFVCGK